MDTAERLAREPRAAADDGVAGAVLAHAVAVATHGGLDLLGRLLLRREALPVRDGAGGPADDGNVTVLEEDGVVGVLGAGGTEQLVDLLRARAWPSQGEARDEQGRDRTERCPVAATACGEPAVGRGWNTGGSVAGEAQAGEMGDR